MPSNGHSKDVLTPKQQAFVQEYLIDLNGAAAAIRAGYSKKTAQEQASRLLSNVMVQAEIQKLTAERNQRLELNADNVLRELMRMGFANMLDYMRISSTGDAVVDLSQLTREQAAAIQEITVEEYVEGRGDDAQRIKRTRFKLGDKKGSLELLGKHMRLWLDRHEISGPALADFSVDQLRTMLTKIQQTRAPNAKQTIQ